MAWVQVGAASRKLKVVEPPAKVAFPSRRQKLCKGLKQSLYPDYVRGMVDYDYLSKLSEEERQWLSAFSEEYYKGWRMREETQVQPIEHLRSSNAAYKRLRTSGDPLAFPGHRHPCKISGTQDRHRPRGDASGGKNDGNAGLELALLAGSRGRDAHELRGQNTTEDEMIRWLDRPKRVR